MSDEAIAFFATWATVFSAIATALATVFLWRVTRILAVETKRMADLSAQPQVIANIVPNQWSIRHADIQVQNTGNATAFDIEVAFDPELTMEARKVDAVPFQRISVLKPGQLLESWLGDTSEYLEKSFTVSVSWKLHPDSRTRQSLSYLLNMADYTSVGFLNSRDPNVQIAEAVKHLRDDWRNVATGQRRIKTDTYDGSDRKREQELLNERFRQESLEDAPTPAKRSAKPSAKPRSVKPRKPKSG